MNINYREKRLADIRSKLQRGDKIRIAKYAGVHPVWVSYVINGKGVSERVMSIAEHLIADRENNNLNQ